MTVSFATSSSVSFLNHVILDGSGFEINLQINSASWPSLTLTFSILAAIFGASLKKKIYLKKIQIVILAKLKHT